MSTRGTSWSVGPRGFKLNFSNRGVRRTVSIPGTGISHSEMLSGSARGPASAQLRTSHSDPPPPVEDRPVRIYGEVTDQTAVDGVSGWVRRSHPLLGRMLPSIVTEVARRVLHRTDVDYTIRSRGLAVRAEPIPRKLKTFLRLAEPSAFDPWADDIQRQLEATRAVTICPFCEGQGNRQCPDCQGTIEIQCDVCGGDGQDVSERSGRLIKCRSCGGDGLKRCPCRDGFIQCAGCAGKGVATSWLVLEEGERIEQCVAGEAPFRGANLADAVRANVKAEYSWEGAANELPETAAGLLADCPLPAGTLGPNDRVATVNVQRHRTEIVDVSYELAGKSGSVEIQGWTGEVKPASDALEPFRGLNRRLFRIWLAAFVASAALLFWFAGRHAYYAESPAAANLALLALLVPSALLPAVTELARGAKHSRGRMVGFTLSAAFLIAIQVLQATEQPSVKRAEEHRAAGQLDAARREARAAVERGRDVEAAAALHDAIQLETVSHNLNPTGLWSALEESHFLTDSGRKQGEEAALELVERTTGDLLEKGSVSQALAILAAVPPALRDAPVVRERSISAYRRSAIAETAIVKSTRPIVERAAACDRVREPFQQLETLGEPFPERTAVDRTCKQVGDLQRAERRRAEQASIVGQQRVERAALAARRRQEAAARAWASAPLMCRDGSLSPSCVCGGSHRGCCSHHGGVAGCSR